MDFTILEEHGLDTKKGLANCMNDIDFYRKLLNMFLKSESFSCGEEAISAKDYKKLFEWAHDLKGVCGNMGMVKLYSVVSVVTEELRGGNPNEQKVEELFKEVRITYNDVRDGIRLALAQK